jgi:NAD(P)-dependent dehydrogenase (short-subunit alcohol dehydrogenase family)
MAGSLVDKVGLVTGGGSGIGRAVAIAFAREWARVIVVDLAADGGNETVRMIGEMGAVSMFIEADVSKDADVELMLNKTVQAYGRLDCAFNNAGVHTGVRIPTHEYPDEEWDRVIAVNLKGVWLCMKHEIIQMLKQGRGAIVNASSGAGLVGAAGASAYTASKHGVIGLTKTAALEYAKEGIRVNAVCPGEISTPMMRRIMDANPMPEVEYDARQPIGRLGAPEEVAEAVVWLCSDAASFVTGHSMAVDGGAMAE